MRFESYSSAEEVARRAADRVAEVIRAKPEAALVLPAGGTPVPLYRELARRRTAGEIDLGRAHLFQLDELVGVPAADERSFAHFLTRHLLEPVGRAGTPGVHLLDGGAASARAEIERHAAALAALGGADLALLGIGTNGHVAFNEPGSRLVDGARRVELAEATTAGLRASFADGALPTHGITLGLAELAASRGLALLATGESKAPVVASLAREAPSSDLPASLLREHPDFLVLADGAAAAAVATPATLATPANGPAAKA